MTEPQAPIPPEPAPSPDATQKLRVGESQDPRSTVKLDLQPPVMESPGRSTPESSIQREKAHSRGLAWKVPAAVVLVAAAGVGAYLAFFRNAPPAPGPATSAPSASENLPLGVQAYIDQAKTGDAHAMRMLGVMYYYGLNVPQDREKGLYWYKQAAEKGSDAAREELSKLQGGEAK